MAGNRPLSRRCFMLGSVATSTICGVPGAFSRQQPEGVSPFGVSSYAQVTPPLPGHDVDKSDLTILGDRPLTMETPAHLLDNRVTSAEHMFVRNNGIPPASEAIAAADWTLKIDGLVDTPLELTLAELKRSFEVVTLQLQLECGGNGRRFFTPAAAGNQWGFGAIACPEWTGVRLADILARAGLQSSAVYTAHYGADKHLSGDPNKAPISRGVPIEKALDPHTLVAWAMNGADLPHLNGYPLRLVVPGWPGSCSQKWLTRISIRDQIHDGPKMTGQSYRVPAYPVAPGTIVPDDDMDIIHSMPVKSLITFPQTGTQRSPRRAFTVRGHAWAGDRDVAAMHVSTDFGASWLRANLRAPANKYAWQHWDADISLPDIGYYEIWARATDETGIMQPATPPGWNPRGYLNNMQHRIAVYAV